VRRARGLHLIKAECADRSSAAELELPGHGTDDWRRRVSAQPKNDSPREAVQHDLRREVNERISSVNKGFGVGDGELIEVVCECAHPRCTAAIALSSSDFERILRHPSRFLVKAGHELAEEELVVDEADGYVVVESRRRDTNGVGA
jgi:hypothetical protein